MATEARHHHINRVISVVTSRDNPNAASAPDELIQRSWMRCATQYGLDPSRSSAARILPSSQLREHQERIDEFLRVARSGMEQLYKQVAPLRYVLLLSDCDGVTVDYIANKDMEKDLKAAGVYLGADWKEDHAGTNGIGAVIAEKTALICHQDDHFDARHIGLSCTAAPIFDPRGNLLAVLNITAMMSPRGKDSQYLALQLTAMHAKTIEDANFIRHFGDQWILRLSRAWPFAEVRGDLMLSFNDEGIIVEANTSARRDLTGVGRPGDWIIGRSLTEVFECTMDDIWRAAKGTSTDTSVMTADSQNLYYLAVRLPRRQKNLRVVLQERGLTSELGSKNYEALDSLAGDDPAMQRALNQAKRLVDRKVNILIHGETGTGKEIFAQALHKSSARAHKPFVALNCGAISESLIESELFGYTPGSFTGGRSKGMKGLIQQSDGGTLFLDEIGDMPLHLQTRLLRVLSENEVLQIGGEKPVRVDLTVIAASHRDLRTMIADGEFREDLYYRLDGATLNLPPLRERNDIRFVIERLLEREAESLGFTASIVPEALEAITRYSWPGNIRELRNALRYALAVSGFEEIRLPDLPRQIVEHCASRYQLPQPPRELHSAPSASGTGQDPKGEQLLWLLKKHRWNITATAAEMGVSRVTVYRQMKRSRIVSPTQTS